MNYQMLFLKGDSIPKVPTPSRKRPGLGLGSPGSDAVFAVTGYGQHLSF